MDRVNLGDLLPARGPGDVVVTDLRDPAAARTWSPDEFAGTVRGVARALRSGGATRGDRVAILSDNRPEFLAAYLGIMQAGLVAVPVNFRLPRETVGYILADAGVRLVFTDGDRRDFVPAGMPCVGFDTAAGAAEPFADWLDPGAFTAVHPAAGETAKILYTSGSTGRPKGVPLAHDGQLWALGKYRSDTPERTIVVAPAYHKNGLFFSMCALANGWPITSLPRFDARRYLEAVVRYRCTLLTGIPTMFALMARERDLLATLDVSFVTTITIGSAPLTDALLDTVARIFPNAGITNGYGTTEAGPAVFGPHPDGIPRPPLSLGYPLADIQWRLSGGPNPDAGVLELRTPALMEGYLHLPDVTAARIRGGWYDTGDVMRRDARGFFFFTGRADDMFVCGGENVYPGEVEKLLERCPGVAQAAVLPVDDEIKGAIPIAFVVPVPGGSLTEDAVKALRWRMAPPSATPAPSCSVTRCPWPAPTRSIGPRCSRTPAPQRPNAAPPDPDPPEDPIMRAVLTTAHGDRSCLSFRSDYPDPQAADGEVLVRIAATALNYHDIFTRRGMPGIRIPLPVVVGSDIAGTVAALGGGVTGWQPGDRVLIDPVYRQGDRFGMIGEVADGGRAELVRVPAAQLLPVPDGVSLEQAAALPLAYGTAHRMLVDRGRIQPGERVLVLGASGGVGVACVQLALLLGAEVVACASSPAKLQRLGALGAAHLIDYTAEDLAGAVRSRFGKPRITGGGGVDVAVNFTGGDTWLPTQKCVAAGGRILTCGATAGFDLLTDARYLWTFEHTVIGSNGWTADDLRALLTLIAEGRLDPVIDRILPLEEAAEAERMLEDREVVGKILLRP